MEIFQIVGIALVATILMVILRQTRASESAVLISVVVGAGILLSLLGKISTVLTVLEELASQASINRFYLVTVLKILAIAYVAEYGAQVCRDAGEGAVAAKVEFAGKVLILVLAVPVIAAILQSVIRLLP